MAGWSRKPPASKASQGQYGRLPRHGNQEASRGAQGAFHGETVRAMEKGILNEGS